MNPLLVLLTARRATADAICPDLPEEAAGLPTVGDAPCEGAACRACADVCPTAAIQVSEDAAGGLVALDRGRCIGCGECLRACPTGTLLLDRSTRTAARRREELVLTNRPADDSSSAPASPAPLSPLFRRSLHVREVSTGCSATDQEVAAATNPVFDVARFGVQFVASPRFADALLVTGPVGRAMQSPLRRCYEAMAEPRLVIAAGTCAISGGLFRDGYAAAQGVDPVLPVDVYIPGCPPHPWSIVHGLLLAMGRCD
jgi:Ni,Fe-hydrogenase III small subunit/NAD-dependent dihydropyrimidine dehydrogenase PreA subunit